jgi:hypothetical protein
MKQLLIVLAFLFCITPNAEASRRHPVRVLAEQSEASIDRDIELGATAERTIAWVDANRDAMRRAAGIEVLKDFGNGKFKVQKVSPKGTFVWITQESIEKRGDKHVFKSILIESVEGGIVASNSEVTITSNGRGVKINVKVSSTVNNPRVKSNQMRLDMNIHFNRVKKLLEDNVR